MGKLAFPQSKVHGPPTNLLEITAAPFHTLSQLRETVKALLKKTVFDPCAVPAPEEVTLFPDIDKKDDASAVTARTSTTGARLMPTTVLFMKAIQPLTSDMPVSRLQVAVKYRGVTAALIVLFLMTNAE